MLTLLEVLTSYPNTNFYDDISSQVPCTVHGLKLSPELMPDFIHRWQYTVHNCTVQSALMFCSRFDCFGKYIMEIHICGIKKLQFCLNYLTGRFIYLLLLNNWSSPSYPSCTGYGLDWDHNMLFTFGRTQIACYLFRKQRQECNKHNTKLMMIRQRAQKQITKAWDLFIANCQGNVIFRKNKNSTLNLKTSDLKFIGPNCINGWLN